MGFARLAEDSIRKIRGRGEHDPGSAVDKILSSSIGGALATWNQPIEVIRVEVIKSWLWSRSELTALLLLDAKYGEGNRKR